ncbi:hypothetical protein J4214_01085 [Candidatus Woesearchaeota archaeon]|nr:hypothetical protein [Candidatus Woesearchaeota archaeon]
MEYLDKGHQGIIYTNSERNIIIKISNKNKVSKETNWLKKLNKYNLGPKLISARDEYLMMEHINGKRILDYIKCADKTEILRLIKEVMAQCRILDKLKVNKAEMHHPVKHILVNKKVTLIDFERCHRTKNPKNVTQFCHFILSNEKILLEKDINIGKNEFIRLVKNYKHNQTEKNFSLLLRFFLSFYKNTLPKTFKKSVNHTLIQPR